MSDKMVSPAQYIDGYVADMRKHGERAPKDKLLYEEMPNGFRCGECRFAAPVAGDVGLCTLVQGEISLGSGCCVAWQYNPTILQPIEQASSDDKAGDV